MITFLINKYHQNQLGDRIRNIAGFHSDEWLLGADGKVGLAVEKISKRLAIVETNGSVHVINGRMVDTADVIVQEQSVSRKPVVRSLIRYAGGRLIGNELTGAVFAFLSREVNWSRVVVMNLEVCTLDIHIPYIRALIFKRGAFVNESKATDIANRWIQILNIIKI